MNHDFSNPYYAYLELFHSENKVLSCQESIDSLKAEVQRAKDEKEDLLSNIEAKEGINTALQQLKVENVS